MRKNFLILISSILITLIIVAASLFVYKFAKAEQTGGSPESGATSQLKTIYNSLVALGHGSDAAGGWGDWGAYLNRIRSAVELLPSNCSTQQNGADSQVGYGNPPVTEGTNCSLTWTTNPNAVTGDDNLAGRGGMDPRTGLTWSQMLLNNAGTVAFGPAATSTWTWNGSTTFTVTAANATAGATYTNNGQTFTVVATIVHATSLNVMATGSSTASGTLTKATGTGDATITFSAIAFGANNAAVGGLTAKQLCSNMNGGGVWRLATQKEMLQAYIDGANFNLADPSHHLWTATLDGDSYVYVSYLYSGIGQYQSPSSDASIYIRCVR